MNDSLSIDHRIMRVALASGNPIDVIHSINTDCYSIITLLDTLEILDTKVTLEEFEMDKARRRAKQGE